MFVFYFNQEEMTIDEFHLRNKRLIHLLTMNAIKECVEKSLEEKAFMIVMPKNEIFTIKKHEFKRSLNNCLIYFENEEMYEECSECLELIRSIN